MTAADILSTLPELVLTVTALGLLLLEVMSRPPRSRFVWVALGGVGLALGVEFAVPSQGQFYAGMISVDVFTRFFDVLFLTTAAGSLLIAVPYLRRTLEERGSTTP